MGLDFADPSYNPQKRFEEFKKFLGCYYGPCSEFYITTYELWVEIKDGVKNGVEGKIKNGSLNEIDVWIACGLVKGVIQKHGYDIVI